MKTAALFRPEGGWLHRLRLVENPFVRRTDNGITLRRWCLLSYAREGERVANLHGIVRRDLVRMVTITALWPFSLPAFLGWELYLRTAFPAQSRFTLAEIEAYQNRCRQEIMKDHVHLLRVAVEIVEQARLKLHDAGIEWVPHCNQEGCACTRPELGGKARSADVH